MPMTPQQFIAKWKKVQLTERSACQQHFLDLCELLGQEKPADADPTGTWYTFERGVDKSEGGKGWADVWMKGKFGWEYKGKHKDLKAAYQQLLRYRESLDNPPLLVLCDLDRFEVHTNFTDTQKKVYEFDLDSLDQPQNLSILRNVFNNPEKLKPGITQRAVTEEIAQQFAHLADGMWKRDIEPHHAAHFLMRLMFCMFAEDIELLPADIFSKTVKNSKNDPKKLSVLLKTLFESMENGGNFGPEEIEFFNGGLFSDAEVIELTPDEIGALLRATTCDWSAVEPTIFGTLFERTLDPAKRSQIGAHYTSRADIETLVKPVIFEPLRREWEIVRAKADVLWEKVRTKAAEGGKKYRESKERKDFDRCVEDFLERLSHVTILDPACGSGNFLYVSLQLLLDLEKEILAYGADHGITRFPLVRPTQLLGLEINPYAHELAQVVIWIGYLQWIYFNGFGMHSPVLDKFESIHNQDAILDLTDPTNPKEPDWPDAEFIVGNPPFLGGSRLWEELGRDYQQGLFRIYDERIPGASDLCCYWFEKALASIANGTTHRAGLIATQSIRGGANREVLNRVKTTGDIFFAKSDCDWILDGASVHISMIGFDDGSDKNKLLDGTQVTSINANLTSVADVTKAMRLTANLKIAFIGTKKAGDFNIPESQAMESVFLPNPHGKPNSNLLCPWLNGSALVKRQSNQWIIDTGVALPLEEFTLYEKLYSHVLNHVKPERQKNKENRTKENWWLFKRTAPEMRVAIEPLHRIIATPRVSKYRIFVWVQPIEMCDDGIYVFASSEDYMFGVLHSKIHEVWARSQGTQVRERESGFRYTPTTCFETFAFPESTEAQKATIADAAKKLDTLRNNWLNPAEWTKTEVLEFPGSVDGPWKRFVHEPNANGIGTVRYSRIIPKDEKAAKDLKKRTLTNLYNDKPTWLLNAHQKLDETVFASYGFPVNISDEDLLAKMLELNLSRAAGQCETTVAGNDDDEDTEEEV